MPESYKYPSAIKRQLDPAHRELMERGFLTRADFEERGRGPAKTNLVRYRVSQKFVRERSKPALELSDEERYVLDALVANGMWPQTAQELVIKQGAGHCLHYVEALPHQEGIKNPAGWLKTHIENSWPVRAPEEPPTLPVAAPPVEDAIQAADGDGRGIAREPESTAGSTADARAAAEEVQRRHAAGEFDEAIEAFETLPYEEYRKFVGHAIRHLDDNRYYVSLDSELYVYVGGREPEHRYFLCRLSRSS
jgi:hypothetical protein